MTIDGADKLAKSLEEKQDDYEAIMIKALADRLVEAFAECLHKQIRLDYWGYAKNESLSHDQLVSELSEV